MVYFSIALFAVGVHCIVLPPLSPANKILLTLEYIVTLHCQFQAPFRAPQLSPDKPWTRNRSAWGGFQFFFCLHFFLRERWWTFSVRLEIILCTMPARPRGSRQEKSGGGDRAGVTHCEITFIHPSEPNESNCDGGSAHLFCAEALTTAGGAVVPYACCFESHKPSSYASLGASVYFLQLVLALAGSSSPAPAMSSHHYTIILDGQRERKC